MIEEKIDQKGDVLAALAQRRHVQLEHAQAVIEVFAKPFLTDVFLQILVRGRDHAHINFHFVGRAHWQKWMAFQNPQQLGLPFERELADFIQKKRSQVGLLKEARVVAVGPGE